MISDRSSIFSAGVLIDLGLVSSAIAKVSFVARSSLCSSAFLSWDRCHARTKLTSGSLQRRSQTILSRWMGVQIQSNVSAHLMIIVHLHTLNAELQYPGCGRTSVAGA